MTDASGRDDDPYTPPPAGEPVQPPAPREPQPPAAYQPPPPAYQPPPPAAPQAEPDAGDAPPAQGRAATSPQTMSIIALVAGAASIFVLPFIAGIVGIALGATTLRLNATARRQGAPANGRATTMAIIGIVLGALGIILKLVVDRML